jgi:hypothetical protein
MRIWGNRLWLVSRSALLLVLSAALSSADISQGRGNARVDIESENATATFSRNHGQLPPAHFVGLEQRHHDIASGVELAMQRYVPPIKRTKSMRSQRFRRENREHRGEEVGDEREVAAGESGDWSAGENNVGVGDSAAGAAEEIVLGGHPLVTCVSCFGGTNIRRTALLRFWTCVSISQCLVTFTVMFHLCLQPKLDRDELC